MCQPKSQGGKRCAIHHAGTQAAIKSVSVQTSVPAENVQEVFSALNKEGKKLDAPSREEYLSFIEKERFITDIDPNLSERDKRMLLKRYAKAETENTPSGGTFHAWKNLLGETVRKYGKAAKKVIATAGVVGMLSLVTACSGQGGAVNPNPTTAPTSSVVAITGDIIANGTVTDEFGSYTPTKLDPKSSLYKLNESVINKDELSAQGFTTEDATAAQKWVLDFVSTEAVDSIALDSPAGWDKWKAEVANKYFDASRAEVLLANATNGKTSNVIYNNKIPVTFARDGKARITKEDIKVSNIGAWSEGGAKYIEVTGQSVVDYRVSEKDNIKAYLAKNPGMTEESLKETNPSFFDGKDETVSVTIDWIYSLIKQGDGSFKLGGYNNTYKSAS